MSTFADLSPEEIAIRRLFFPHAIERLENILKNKRRFVHYTSAEVAMSIIQGKTVWMRNATTMNDFSEVRHGLDCLATAWNDHPSGEKIKSVVDSIYPGISEEVATLFDGWQDDLKSNTYLTCLSEHLDKEDDNGRLSMWRAYGGRSGVALVLNLTPFVANTDKLGAYSSPVAYLHADGIADQMGRIAREIENSVDKISTLGRDLTAAYLFTMLRMAAVCTKHPGFMEELEWRIIYSPTLSQSPAITPAVHAVRGIPQIIQKIPLRNSPEEGLHGAAIPDLLDRLIIGPTEDQGAVYDAFRTLLAEAGVQNPASRIRISGIPLRQ